MNDDNKIPYRYLCIEGNIGAGKTTVSEKISALFNCKIVLEQFTDNPFLPLFYENPERYAFSVETFFMTERHKQLQKNIKQQDLFYDSVVADYFFVKTLLFAKNNLNSDEYRLFKRLFRVLNSTFPNPDLLIYLYRPIDELLHHIRLRGRSYESNITYDYLQNIQSTYLSYLKTETDFPVVIVDASGADFLNERSDDFDKLLQIISADYENGLHQTRIKDEPVHSLFF
ncbi:MAG: deoxynucleoside kinase [Saprospiraceae bacterium]|nr:deoxynucleoside kinase [Saprospiraceae bacterium]